MYGSSAQTFLNYRIPSDKRATILSFASATSQIGMILGLVVTGIICENFNNLNPNQMPIRISWVLCGCIALIAGFIGFYFLSEKYSVNKN